MKSKYVEESTNDLGRKRNVYIMGEMFLSSLSLFLCIHGKVRSRACFSLLPHKK